MTEIKKMKISVEISYNMFYNTIKYFYNGGIWLSPILMLTPDRSAMFTSTVVIAGISIVLGVLLLLILVFYLFGFVVSTAEKRAKDKAKKKNSKTTSSNGGPTVTPAPATVSVPVKAPEPVIEQGISGEVVAAIAAAVAISEGPQAVVRSIKKVNVGGRNPWAQAANVDNTRPF